MKHQVIDFSDALSSFRQIFVSLYDPSPAVKERILRLPYSFIQILSSISDFICVDFRNNSREKGEMCDKENNCDKIFHPLYHLRCKREK